MVLKPTSWNAKTEGSLVKLTFGNVVITVEYDTALAMGAHLRLRGREAKRNAGDHSGMTIRALGHLTDANEDEKRWQKLRDPTSAYK